MGLDTQKLMEPRPRIGGLGVRNPGPKRAEFGVRLKLNPKPPKP